MFNVYILKGFYTDPFDDCRDTDEVIGAWTKKEKAEQVQASMEKAVKEWADAAKAWAKELYEKEKAKLPDGKLPTWMISGPEELEYLYADEVRRPNGSQYEGYYIETLEVDKED